VSADIALDKKGDITQLDYVMYIWKEGRRRQDHFVQCPASGCRDVKAGAACMQ